MGWLGIAMFLYVPGGWINNRFTVRSILCAWCTWRFVTGLILFSIPNLSFDVMIVIAASWGVWDAIGWPAVVNGVASCPKMRTRRVGAWQWACWSQFAAVLSFS